MGTVLCTVTVMLGRTQWQHVLWRGSAAARLLGLRFRVSPEAWISVSCHCCVLSGRGLYHRPISSPEESYRVCVRACVRAV